MLGAASIVMCSMALRSAESQDRKSRRERVNEGEGYEEVSLDVSYDEERMTRPRISLVLFPTWAAATGAVVIGTVIIYAAAIALVRLGASSAATQSA